MWWWSMSNINLLTSFIIIIITYRIVLHNNILLYLIITETVYVTNFDHIKVIFGSLNHYQLEIIMLKIQKMTSATPFAFDIFFNLYRFFYL